MKRYFCILFLCFFLTSYSHSQFASHFNSSKNWSMNKHSIYFAIGPTQFLGDLGGMNREGKQKSLADINWGSTRYGIAFGYRFRFHPRWATTTQLYAGMLSGDDARTDAIIRRSRNLSFRSPIIQLTQRVECIIWANERVGARYKFRGFHGMRPKADFFYVFSGITGFFFNPQMQIDGKWTNLRPLRTEGQGLPGGPDEYSRFNLAIPFGVGFKFAISRFWRIGVEAIYQKTFTDYLDDVSTDYYDPEVLEAKVGSEAVYAANPAIANHSWFREGMQRGNSADNDAYFLFNITFTRNITYSNRTTSKRTRWRGRSRF